MNPYKELANAIIVQAVGDYRDAGSVFDIHRTINRRKMISGA